MRIATQATQGALANDHDPAREIDTHVEELVFLIWKEPHQITRGQVISTATDDAACRARGAQREFQIIMVMNGMEIRSPSVQPHQAITFKRIRTTSNTIAENDTCSTGDEKRCLVWKLGSGHEHRVPNGSSTSSAEAASVTPQRGATHPVSHRRVHDPAKRHSARPFAAFAGQLPDRHRLHRSRDGSPGY